MLMKEGELCSAEIVEVGSRDIQVPLEANELNDLQSKCACSVTTTFDARQKTAVSRTFSGVLYFRKSL